MITFNMLDSRFDEELEVRIFDYRFGSNCLPDFPQEKSFEVGEKTKTLDEQLDKYAADLEKKEASFLKKLEKETA